MASMAVVSKFLRLGVRNGHGPSLMPGCKYTTSAVPKNSDLVEESVESFNSYRGDALSSRHWRCNNNKHNLNLKSDNSNSNRATIILSHGYGSHSGRWANRAHHWAERRFDVSCHDHVGHGLSSGTRAQVLDYRWFTEDLLKHTLRMKERNPEVPLFGVGQSMGALIMLKLAMNRPELFDGIILSAVNLAIDPKISTPTTLFLARMFHKFYPSFGLFDWKEISGEKDEIDAYTKDGLCYQGKFKAGIAYASYLCISDCIENMEKLTTPVFIVHGKRDRIAPVRGAEELMRRAQSRDKGIKIYDGPHSLFMDARHGLNVLNECTAWMQNRL